MLGEEVCSRRKSGSMGKGLRGSANRVSVFVSFESINEIIMKCRVCNATHVPNVVSPEGLTTGIARCSSYHLFGTNQLFSHLWNVLNLYTDVLQLYVLRNKKNPVFARIRQCHLWSLCTYIIYFIEVLDILGSYINGLEGQSFEFQVSYGHAEWRGKKY